MIEAGLLERRKYIFGIPYLYTVSHKGRNLLGVNKRADTIRLDRITHDIYVLDTVIYYMMKYNVSLCDIESEKELHIKDGFGMRKHCPDFVAVIEGRKYAVEIELNPKAKNRIEKNIRDNYLNYDNQIWFTNDNRVFSLIQGFQDEYSNIEIIRLEKVSEYVGNRYK